MTTAAPGEAALEGGVVAASPGWRWSVRTFLRRLARQLRWYRLQAPERWAATRAREPSMPPWRIAWLLARGHNPLHASGYLQRGHSLRRCVSDLDTFALHRLNGPYRHILTNKLAFALHLQAHGLPHPDVFGYRAGGRWIWLGDGLERMRAACAADGVLIKPTFGRQSTNISFAGDPDAVLALETNDVLAVRRVRSGGDAARLFPATLNVVKLLCYRPTPQRYDIGVACQLVGAAQSGVVDSLTKGGLGVGIDPATGTRLEAFKLEPGNRLRELTHHPDTGAQLGGTTIDVWPEVLALVDRLMAAFPFCRYVLWDLGLTPDGVVVIEGNNYPGLNFHQWRRPLLEPSPFATFLRAQTGRLRRRERPKPDRSRAPSAA